MLTDTFRLVGLLALLLAAVMADIRTRKVPNKLIVIGALSGTAFALLPDGIGFGQSIGGLFLGLAMLLPMYALRAMGAGDLKLMACIGSFLGIEATFLSTLFALAAGGVLALLYSARAGSLMQVVSNMKMFVFHTIVRVSGGGLPRADDMPVSRTRMPYSLAISAGVILYLATRFYSTGAFT